MVDSDTDIRQCRCHECHAEMAWSEWGAIVVREYKPETARIGRWQCTGCDHTTTPDFAEVPAPAGAKMTRCCVCGSPDSAWDGERDSILRVDGHNVVARHRGKWCVACGECVIDGEAIIHCQQVYSAFRASEYYRSPR
jgi:hypothetical protein